MKPFLPQPRRERDISDRKKPDLLSPDLQIAYLPVFDTLLEGEAPLAEAASAPEAGQSQPASRGRYASSPAGPEIDCFFPACPRHNDLFQWMHKPSLARAAATGAPLVRPVSGLSSPVSSAPAVQLQPVSGIRPAPATAGKVQTPEEIAISAAERPSRPATRSGPGRSGAAIPGRRIFDNFRARLVEVRDDLAPARGERRYGGGGRAFTPSGSANFAAGRNQSASFTQTAKNPGNIR